MDDKLLNRVRGLLAKAESTDFPEEGEALRAKAEALMIAHGIEQVMLNSTREVKETATHIVIKFEDPFSNRKSFLLHVVSSALGCKSVAQQATRGSSRDTHSTVFGFPSNLEQVEFLYTSLLVQAERELMKIGVGMRRIRSMRSGFLFGFAVRAGERLEDIYAKAVAETVDSAPGAALVLVERAEAVEAAFQAMFPDSRTSKVRGVNPLGFNAGHEAANRADLGQGRFGRRSKELTTGS